MPYETPAALRAALEARLLNESRENLVDLQRLRRRAVFERVLVRLVAEHPGMWIVKGGIALEVRMQERARATKDLDLAIRQEEIDGEKLRELVIAALNSDEEGDGFTFVVGQARAISAEMGGHSGWRFAIICSLAGREFATVRIDIVPRTAEFVDTYKTRLPGALAFAGYPVGEIEVIGIEQHFAEKLHALTKTYGDRPNSRVRDLADLVLLMEEGFGDLPSLRHVVEVVFEDRSTHPVPIELPDPQKRGAKRTRTSRRCSRSSQRHWMMQWAPCGTSGGRSLPASDQVYGQR